ncbi:MAG: GNAT family protein [Actinomycetia bacterium]|nr:GNAT family protein [Actinomycetes bacterium]
MARGEVTLAGRTPLGESLVLRPFRMRDQQEYIAARGRDRQWLTRWDPTSPDGQPTTTTFREMVRRQRAKARAGDSLAFLIESRGTIVGQINGNSIVWGAALSFSAGYWVASASAGRWIAPTAVALLGDYGFGGLGLHRLELGIRPENTASLAVARKLRMREEGLRPNYLHIDGAWRDHAIFALTAEDLAEDGHGATFRERLQRSYDER